MDENKAPKRRRFNFTIRELLLLTVIVALAVGWWLDHRRQRKEIIRYALLDVSPPPYPMPSPPATPAEPAQ